MCKMASCIDLLISLLTLDPPPSFKKTAVEMLADSADSGTENKVFYQFSALLESYHVRRDNFSYNALYGHKIRLFLSWLYEVQVK